MAPTQPSQMNQKLELESLLEDVSLRSSSVSSDDSYDFANVNGSTEGDKVIAPDLASYTPIPNVVAGASPNAGKEDSAEKFGGAMLSASLFQRARSLVMNPSTATPFSEKESLERKNSKWRQESQMTTGESDVESVVSEDSALENSPETSEKDTISAEYQENQDFDGAILDDSELSTLRSKVEAHCENMVNIVDDAPSQMDARTSKLIGCQLRKCSRDIAAMFGDDIVSLKTGFTSAAEKMRPTLQNAASCATCWTLSDLQRRRRSLHCWHVFALPKPILRFTSR